MDCFTDMMCRAVLPRLQAEPRLLELTKVADVDPALARELPDAAFADRGRRELPVHTAAHTALSRLYLDHNPGLPTEVVEEVKQACAAFGLPEELFAPRAPKVASAPDPADFLFPEERRVRVATAEEVSRAARKLSDEGMRLVAGERVAAARRLRAKAAALGVQLPDAAAAERDLKWWCGWVARSKIPEMQKVARTLRSHWDGVIAYLRTRITNGAAEALNGIIQTAKRKARGFKTTEYFSAIIYLTSSHLHFDLPNPIPITHTNSH
jgi:hypothetical protein